LPYCAGFKHKIQRQHAATMQADRRRVEAMDCATMRSGKYEILLCEKESSLILQDFEATTTSLTE